MNENKTVLMRKEDFDKWIKALRSGEYVQGKKTLYNSYRNTYCCLGVLQHCLSGETENANIPSREWLNENKVKFLDNLGTSTVVPMLGEFSAWQWNDLQNATFNEIADLLEKHFQATDE